MSLTGRRLARLAGTGSPAKVVRAIRREIGLRRGERELEETLASDEPLVVGPFLGEVGFELLYWRPWVLRLLRRARVERERVTVIGRGGSGAWYEDVAGRTVDAFELLGPDEIRTRMEARARATGERKQSTVDELDRELVRLAGGGSAIHPLHMFLRSRFLWEGLRPPADAHVLGDYDELGPAPLEPALAERLPARYVAVKTYFNECVPDTPSNRGALADAIGALAREVPVVLLEAGIAVDNHADWEPDGVRTIGIADLLVPERNLAQQAGIVARAQALVATYGGFSYVGPFTGVKTVALSVEHEDNPRHEEILRAVRPASAYTRIGLDPEALLRAVSG